MLIGEYLHTLDSKKRLSLPAKFRKEVGKKVVITRGLDACLFYVPTKTWEAIAEKLEKLPFGQSDTRGMSRFILAGAVETDVDGAGRILVPDFLKEFADLRSRVVLAGVFGPGRDLEREDVGGVQAPHREGRRPDGADAWRVGHFVTFISMSNFVDTCSCATPSLSRGGRYYTRADFSE